MKARLWKVTAQAFCWLVYTYGAITFLSAHSALFLLFTAASVYYAWLLYREIHGRGVL